MKRIKISVIIPVYNKLKYLRKTAQSLLDQTLSDIEIIFIDDGSTDGSGAILKEVEQADSRVQVLYQPNAGAGAARNKGIEVASGDYLAFFDADDYFDPSMLEVMYDSAVKYDADIATCSSWRFVDDLSSREPDFTIKKHLIKRGVVTPHDDNIDPFRDFNVVIWNKIFRSDFINRNNIRYQTCKTSNDVYFAVYSVLKAKRISIVGERLVSYRKGMSGNLQDKKKETPLDCFIPLEALSKDRVVTCDQHIRKCFNNFVIGNIAFQLDTIHDYDSAKAIYDHLVRDSSKLFVDNDSMSLINRFRSLTFLKTPFEVFYNINKCTYEDLRKGKRPSRIHKLLVLVRCYFNI